MRVVFMGTPAFAVPTLIEIVGQGHTVAAVYTRAPSAAGRGMALRASAVGLQAERSCLPVLSPSSLRGPDEAAAFQALHADVAVVVAYGLLLPPAVLAAPRLGCLNLHGSLLPRWRGAAPMQRAIMAGDADTGVMVMRMEAGLDTGPVAMTERVPITADMTAGALHDRLAPLGANLMMRALAALDRGTLSFHPQPAEGVTYARKIEKAECRIDWTGPAQEVHDHVRGLSPFPGAFFETNFGRGPERVKVLGSHCLDLVGTPGAILDASPGHLAVACGTGAIEITRLQRAGKPPVDTADFLRGTPVRPGHTLSLAAG